MAATLTPFEILMDLNRTISELFIQSLKQVNTKTLIRQLQALKSTIEENLNHPLSRTDKHSTMAALILEKILVLSELLIKNAFFILPYEHELIALFTKLSQKIEFEALAKIVEEVRAEYAKILNQKFIEDSSELKESVDNEPLKSRCHQGIEKQLDFLQEIAKKYSLKQFEPISFWKTLANVANSDNPEVSTSIEYVVVMSGRGSYLKRQIDFPDKKELEVDDFDRLNLGIQSALEITAKRLQKPINQLTQSEIIQCGPTLIYNGRPGHNQDLFLSQVLQNPPPAFQYPAQKIKVLNLRYNSPTDNQYHTKGQFECLREKLNINSDTLFVTSAYHAVRILHMLGKNSPVNPVGNKARLYLRLVNRQFLDLPNTTDVVIDCAGEHDRVGKYATKGDIAPYPCQEVIYRGKEESENSIRRNNGKELKKNGEISETTLIETRKLFIQYERLKEKESGKSKPITSVDDLFIYKIESKRRKKIRDFF